MIGISAGSASRWDTKRLFHHASLPEPPGAEDQSRTPRSQRRRGLPPHEWPLRDPSSTAKGRRHAGGPEPVAASRPSWRAARGTTSTTIVDEPHRETVVSTEDAVIAGLPFINRPPTTRPVPPPKPNFPRHTYIADTIRSGSTPPSGNGRRPIGYIAKQRPANIRAR